MIWGVLILLGAQVPTLAGPVNRRAYRRGEWQALHRAIERDIQHTYIPQIFGAHT